MKSILAAFLLLLGSGLASAQELFPLQQVPGGGGGGGGPGTPFGNIPCPRGCTWTVAFADDFTVDTSFSYDRTANVTNALWYVPPDGSGNPTANTPGPNGTFACDQGALDVSHLPGHLDFHAVGTAAWEQPNNLSCGIFPKVSTTYTPVGCSDGWYTESCTPISKPVIYEYKAQLAVNQIFEVQACCSIELYFYEARGNGTSFNGGIPHVIGGESVEVGSPVVELDRAPTVVDVLVDPQAGYTWYTNGTAIYSANPGNCPSGTCDGLTATYYMFNDAISNACGGACAPGGTTMLYWVKEFQGQ